MASNPNNSAHRGYPWDAWLDGNEHTLIIDQDYPSRGLDSLRYNAMKAAASRGKTVRVNIREREGKITIQATEKVKP